MAKKVETLQEEFEAARDEYFDDPSEENRKAFDKAMQAFSNARTSQKQDEEVDPDHPRGRTLAAVDNSVQDAVIEDGDEE